MANMIKVIVLYIGCMAVTLSVPSVMAQAQTGNFTQPPTGDWLITVPTLINTARTLTTPMKINGDTATLTLDSSNAVFDFTLATEVPVLISCQTTKSTFIATNKAEVKGIKQTGVDCTNVNVNDAVLSSALDIQFCLAGGVSCPVSNQAFAGTAVNAQFNAVTIQNFHRSMRITSANLEIKNSVFEHTVNSNSPGGVVELVSGSKNILIESSTFRNVSREAVFLSPDTTNATVRSSTFDSASAYAITSIGDDGNALISSGETTSTPGLKDIVIDSNTFDNTMVTFRNVTGLTLTNNIFKGALGVFVCDICEGLVITGNTFETPLCTAITVIAKKGVNIDQQVVLSGNKGSEQFADLFIAFTRTPICILKSSTFIPMAFAVIAVYLIMLLFVICCLPLCLRRAYKNTYKNSSRSAATGEKPRKGSFVHDGKEYFAEDENVRTVSMQMTREESTASNMEPPPSPAARIKSTKTITSTESVEVSPSVGGSSGTTKPAKNPTSPKGSTAITVASESGALPAPRSKTSKSPPLDVSGVRLRAKYAYTARSPDELTFKKHQILIGVELVQGGGWWLGDLDGQRGLFPANYVVPHDDDKSAASPPPPSKPKVTIDPAAKAASAVVVATTDPSAPPKPPKPAKPRKPSFMKKYDSAQGMEGAAAASAGGGARAAAANDDPEPPPPPPPGKPKKEKKEAKGPETPPEKMRYTLYAHNLAYGASLLMTLTGALSFLWNAPFASGRIDYSIPSGTGTINAVSYIRVNVYSSVYSLLAGLLLYYFEYHYGLIRSEPAYGIPVRGIVMMLGSIPNLVSDPLVMAGCALLFAGVVNIIADVSGEVGDVSGVEGHYILWFDKTDKDAEKAVMKQERVNCCQRLRDSGRIGQIVFATAYIALNLGLGLEAFVRWHGIVAACTAGPRLCPSDWAPFAKMFGQLLNFNCALILVPVIKIILTKLNNAEITPRLSVASFIPLRKNIIFHKLIALVVAISTAGHIIIHYINFSITPSATLTAFGPYPWTTGVVITLAMIVIYSGAQNRVKRAHYEIFWVSHHGFIFFFMFLVAHGPSFYIWSCIPLLLYVLERIKRLTLGNKPFLLRTVRYIPPVMELEFCPKNKEHFFFKEGQYTYLASPYISPNEWHPFTISSCHYDLVKDDTISLHIRIQKDGSWTSRLKNYFSMMARPRMMGKDGRFELIFTHYDQNGQVQGGKYLGPDGTPLILIDGPHAAPAQHYSEYAEAMIIGAGIGLTPVSSIMKAVLRQKWKLGFFPHRVHFYWIVRHSEVDSFTWFIKLLFELMCRLASDRVAGAISPDHHIDINIYVSSVPKTKTSMKGRGYSLDDVMSAEDNRFSKDISRVASVGGKNGKAKNPNPAELGPGYDVDIGFTQKDLHSAILNPTGNAKHQASVQTANNKPDNRYMDIWIWEGRPEW